MADLITILSSAGLSVLLSAALVFLAKSWISERLKNAIKHEYDEKLETHRAQLKAEHETEIERLRADLRVAAHQKEIHLTRLHEEAANTIAKTYALLHDVDSTVRAYTKIMEAPGDPPQGAAA